MAAADKPARPDEAAAVSQQTADAPSADAGAVAAEETRGHRGAKPAAAGPRRESRHRGSTATGRHESAGARHRSTAAAHHAAPSERAEGDHRRAAHADRGRLHERLDELSRVALKTAERYSFPLSLALFVLLFMAVQSRIDRRDPKLRLAPLDSKHDLASFV
jgi:hypothetical protein